METAPDAAWFATGSIVRLDTPPGTSSARSAA